MHWLGAYLSEKLGDLLCGFGGGIVAQAEGSPGDVRRPLALRRVAALHHPAH